MALKETERLAAEGEEVLTKHPEWSGQLDAVLLNFLDDDFYSLGDGREIIHELGDVCLIAAYGGWTFPYPHGFTPLSELGTGNSEQEDNR